MSSLHGHARRLQPSAVAAACCALLVLLAGCSVLPTPGRGGSQDERFAELSDYVPEDTEIQTRTAPVANHMPGLEVTAPRWMAYRTDARDLLPTPDAPYRLHAVVALSPHNAGVLDAASTTAPDLLPPVPTDLHHYVPQHCTSRTH